MFQREGTGRARLWESEGALAWTEFLTPSFITGNNFRDESAELLCLALSVRSRAWVQPGHVRDVPGDLGDLGGAAG